MSRALRRGALAEAAWAVYIRHFPPVSPEQEAPEAMWKEGFMFGRGLMRTAAWLYCTLATVVTLSVLVPWVVSG